MTRPLRERFHRALTMLSLILAGEAVFLPAFHLGRYFKSSLLATFQIDEFQLGRLGAIYGVFAMACYVLGGPLADRWSPRKLLSGSLVATAIGSLYMASNPSFNGLRVLFACWGVTTILAFWAPLIRATREWAGEDAQARAFGILDGGRGLASAAIASIAAYAFTQMVGTDEVIDPVDEAAAVNKLVLGYGVNCLIAAVCVWLFVPDPAAASGDPSSDDVAQGPGTLRRLRRVLSSPAIWLQAVVIIAAYSAFKMIDNYGIYSEDVGGLSRTSSAKLIAYISYVRVGSALAAGWIADKFLGVRHAIMVCFGLLICGYVVFLALPPTPNFVWLMVANMVVTCIGFFALRGIYFALLEESDIPRELTGTAVGVISFVGYAPEIFMGPLTGWLIREAREAGNVAAGYQQIYWVLLCLSICGLVAAWSLRYFIARGGDDA